MKKYLITENQFKYLVNHIIKEDIEKEQEKAIEQIKLRHKIEDRFVDEILPNLEKKEDSVYIYYLDKRTGKIYIEYNILNNEAIVDWRLTDRLQLKGFRPNDFDTMRHILSEYLDISTNNITLTNLNQSIE